MVLGNYIVDFVCLRRRLVVELDGRGHLGEQQYDEARTRWLGWQGFRVVRFWNRELEEDIGHLTQLILERLLEAGPCRAQ